MPYSVFLDRRMKMSVRALRFDSTIASAVDRDRGGRRSVVERWGDRTAPLRWKVALYTAPIAGWGGIRWWGLWEWWSRAAA